MPHIHNNPGEHDATVSAFVIRMQDDEPLCLVHMHRKLNMLMQPGGHIELTETPWGAIAHELREETGYTLDEISVLQPTGMRLQLDEKVVTHPVPLLVNTHPISDTHFHTDQSFAFIARTTPVSKPAEGESEDLRWLTVAEMQKCVDKGQMYNNVFRVYEAIVTYYLEAYEWLPATNYSPEDPPKKLNP